MAKSAGHRRVYCYLCGHPIEVGARAMSTSCPGCHKPVVIEDEVIKTYKPVFNIQTCGKLTVKKKARAVAQKVIAAHCGMDIQGAVECKEAVSGGHVVLGPKAEWKGDLRCPSIEIAEGAKFVGRLIVPDEKTAGLYPQPLDGSPEEPPPKKTKAAKKKGWGRPSK